MNRDRRSLTQLAILVVLFFFTPLNDARAQLLDGEKDPQPSRATLAIQGGMLIDGHGGPPLPHAVVLIDGDRIAAVSTRAELEIPDGTKIIDASSMTIMPGLIDVHVHLDLIGHSNYAYWHRTYSSRYEEIMEVSARQLIMNGVTTVLDLTGDPNILMATQKKIESGAIPGPRVKASMGWITAWPDEEWRAHHRTPHLWNIHNVEEARAAARRVIDEYGADIVKIHTGVTEEQTKAIAEEARKSGLKVTGHTGDRQDTIMRIRSGQNAIEHLYLGTPVWTPKIHADVIEAMLDHGTYVIPTTIQTMIQEKAILFPDWKDNVRARSTTPPDLWADIRRSIDHPHRFLYTDEGVRTRRVENTRKKVKQLYDAGVRVLVGTDAATPMNFHTDAMWQEMDLFVQYGIPPMEVIVTATRRNAEYLGSLRELGTVTRGKLADIIVVDGNPLLSMRDLRNVVTVIKDGKIYKQDGRPTS